MADTIAAISTGNCISAIGIVRMSGDRAIDIADKVFKPITGKLMSQVKDRMLVYGTLCDASGEPIDICLCTISRGPGSYTGEDTCEFQCHGSPTVLSAALEALFTCGARQALAGEFTRRAFLNNRMDLSMAEAVIDIIDSETILAAKSAVGQLSGSVYEKIDGIYSELIDIMAHFHAVLDYPDEEIESFLLENYYNVFTSAEDTLNKMLSTFERGRVIREGIKCTIVGKPNVGKSSLLNLLLGYDRAIVTEIAGTTRDTIEEKVKIGDVILRLTDTAGIHFTEDSVEKIGVSRSLEALREAELVIAVFDGSKDLDEEDFAIIHNVEESAKLIYVLNKSDIGLKADLTKFKDGVCILSAKSGDGLNRLENQIKNLFITDNKTPIGDILTNRRHAEAITRALSSINDAHRDAKNGITPDIVLTELEIAISALGEITGKTVRDDITDRIFSRFCVGK